MELAILVIAFIVAIIAFYVGYSTGSTSVDTSVKIDNSKLEQEKISLEKEISLQKQNLDSIKQQYEDKLKYINSAKQRAENEYNAWTEIFEDKKQQAIQEAEELKIELKNATDEERNKLQSLQRQKAATIEAFQKEKAIQEQKDLYRLDITEQDKIDIGFLKSIQYRISKPRILAMLIWQTYYQGLAKKKFAAILGSENVCGIYKITNSLNQMCYIGQAKDIRKRWMEHCKFGLGIDTPQGNKLYKSMLEDGLENFTFELLEECIPEELNEKEKYYISVYNSVNFGYNSVKGNN